jgi:hypothetical protein
VKIVVAAVARTKPISQPPPPRKSSVGDQMPVVRAASRPKIRASEMVSA